MHWEVTILIKGGSLREGMARNCTGSRSGGFMVFSTFETLLKTVKMELKTFVKPSIFGNFGQNWNFGPKLGPKRVVFRWPPPGHTSMVLGPDDDAKYGKIEVKLR